MNTKKKILFLVTQSEFGGAQRFIYRLITNLDLSKYDISVAAGPEGDNADGLLFNVKKEGFGGFSLKFLKRKINPFIDFLGILEIRKLIKKENPDIVFLCSTKAGILGSIASKVNGKRVIYRIGGWTFNDPWPKWKKRLYAWVEKRTAGLKDFIINNAEVDKQQAVKLGIRPKKEILTIYNGIDVENLKFLDKEKAINVLGLGPEICDQKSKLIGTIANLYPAKGLEYLIEAVKITNNSFNKFVIIGEGKERSKLEKLIRKNNLDNVFLVGAIPDAHKHLKAFDAFILPSVKEGFPWTILEAMAAEVPVVATAVGAIPEIIKDGESGILIEPRNPKLIAVSIERIINDNNLTEKLVRGGKRIVEEKFNIKKMIKEYENLFFID